MEYSTKALLLNVWTTDQLHRSPGSLFEIRLSGPTPDLLNQNLHFTKIPDDINENSVLRSTVLKGIVNFLWKPLGLRQNKTYTIDSMTLV